jgi:nickel-dependent lactate racemase
MEMQSVSLPQKAWYGDTQIELTFPASWDLNYLSMPVENRPKLSREGILKAFSKPIGTKPISELARGKKEVIILFDDMTRPTRVNELVPFVLDELHRGGIEDKGIRFLCSPGTHGALKLDDFEKKLGKAVLERFPVYNHNSYENCTLLGHTSFGTPVSLNTEFVNCDLKIGIGCILPHWTRGFGGGGKLMMPGIAHIDTIEANHSRVAKSGPRNAVAQVGVLPDLPTNIGWGKYEGNRMRLDIEEAVRMAGFDIIVNAIVNLRRETTDLFVGDPIEAHIAGVKVAEKVYPTPRVFDMDIVVANTFFKANEAPIAAFLSRPCIKESGGDMVLIVNAPDGQVTHYLRGSFGKTIGGRLMNRTCELATNIKRFFILSEYPDYAGWEWLAPSERIIWKRNWQEILDELITVHGDKARVSVFPDATIQYFKS